MPAPKVNLTSLGRYRALSPLASVHVSPLQLGAMSIGDKWEKMGETSKKSCFELLDAFYAAGGNFIDTANLYQDGSSEEFVGEWANDRGIRDQLVIATKYAGNYMRPFTVGQQNITYVGNNVKSMNMSLEASLKKLKTTYVDIFYVHWWDYNTSVEEVMNGLHNLVASGKVLYLGISDTPAWVVSKANMYARAHGKTPFAIYQGQWNVMQRSFEREIIPMARSEGLALAPWNVINAGRFRTDKEEEDRLKSGENGRTMFAPEWKRNENEKKVSYALEKVAAEVGAEHITAVAIAYVMHKAPYVFPLVGGRKVSQLEANITALDITLSQEQIEYLEGVIPFDPGWPSTMIGNGTANSRFFNAHGPIDRVTPPQPIKHKQS